MRARLILMTLFLGLIFDHAAMAQSSQVTQTAPANPAPGATTSPPAVQPTPQYATPPAVALKPGVPQAAAPALTSQPAQIPATQTTAQPAMAASTKPAVASVSTAPPLSAQAEAEKMIEITHAMADGQQMGDTIVAPIIAAITSRTSMPPQKEQEMKQIFKEEFSKAINGLLVKIKPEMISIYTQNFTVDELHTINQFYESPVGKKAITLEPALFQKGAELGRAEMQKEMPAVIQRIQKRLNNAGIYLPN